MPITEGVLRSDLVQLGLLRPSQYGLSTFADTLYYYRDSYEVLGGSSWESASRICCQMPALRQRS